MKFLIEISFDAEQSDWEDGLGDAIEGVLGALPFMADNVEIEYWTV